MECPSLHPDDLMRMPKGKLVKAFIAMAGELAEVKLLNLAFAQQIEELLRSAGKTSRNSSLPPSSDGLSKPTVEEVSENRTRSLRGKSNRDPGGQPGHRGRTLRQIETPDEVVDHLPSVCQRCNARLPKGLAFKVYARRQVHDLPPPPKIHVVEHRAHSCPCPNCGKIAKAAFPGDVAGPVQYGKRVEAYVAYLSGIQLVPLARLADILADLFNARVSQAALLAMIRRTAKKFREPMDLIRKALLKADLKHLDETGLRVAGKLHWVHVICNALLCVLRVDPSRGAVPEDCLGTVVHDHFAPYFSRLEKVARHAMCNIHHKREAKAAYEQDGHPWAGEMIRFLDKAKRATDIARRLGRERLTPRLLSKFDRWFDRIIAGGEEYYAGLPDFVPARAGKRGRKKRRIAENFQRRLKKRKKETLLFLYDLSVPFTNNEAEQNLRMITVKENISGCFRTLEGAEDHLTLSSVAITSRKQGLNVLEVFAGTPESFIEALRFE